MKLAQNNEIVGTISEVRDEDDCIKMMFSLQKELEIPKNAISPEELKDLISKRVGIINCDGRYMSRIIAEK